MNVVNIMKVVALTSVSFFFAGAGVFMLSLRHDIIQSTADIHDTSIQVSKAVGSIQIVAADLHAQTPEITRLVKEANLGVKESQYLILQAGLTTRAVHEAAEEETATLDTLNHRVDSTLADTDETVVRIGKAVTTLDDTVADLRPVISSATGTLDQTTLTLNHVDALVTNPAIPQTLNSVQAGTKSGAAIVEDAQIEADKLTHPNKKKLGFWGTTDAVFVWIHSHVLPPIF